MTPSEKQKIELRLLILDFFGEKGKTMEEFRAAWGAKLTKEGFSTLFVRNFIYGMATAGLLFDIGGNKGTFYRRTAAGRAAIPFFKRELEKYE